MELIKREVSTNETKHSYQKAAWLVSVTSENTRSSYGSAVKDYLAWLDLDGLDLLDANRAVLNVYRLYLERTPSKRTGKTPSSATVALKLSAISSFYAYMVQDNYASTNPVSVIKRPKVSADHSSTQGLTVGQAKALLEVAKNTGHSSRAYALIRLILNTGIRISEALEARMSDLGNDQGHRVLTVTRKGGERQKIVLNASAIQALEEYLGNDVSGSALATGNESDAFIFTTRDGEQWNRVDAFKTIQQLASKAGIEGKISPHSLRHTFATVALDNDVELHNLQDSMGHADPRTTRRYDRSRNRLEKSASHKVMGQF